MWTNGNHWLIIFSDVVAWLDKHFIWIILRLQHLPTCPGWGWLTHNCVVLHSLRIEISGSDADSVVEKHEITPQFEPKERSEFKVYSSCNQYFYTDHVTNPQNFFITQPCCSVQLYNIFWLSVFGFQSHNFTVSFRSHGAVFGANALKLTVPPHLIDKVSDLLVSTVERLTAKRSNYFPQGFAENKNWGKKERGIIYTPLYRC